MYVCLRKEEGRGKRKSKTYTKRKDNREREKESERERKRVRERWDFSSQPVLMQVLSIHVLCVQLH